jgi:hypothetical protein
VNKSAEEEILQLKKEGISLFQETRKVFDRLKKDYIIVTFASEDKDLLEEYFLTTDLSMKLSSEELVLNDDISESNNEEISSKIAPSIYVFLGDVITKASFKSVKINVIKNKNARVNGVQHYSCESYTSGNNITTASVQWYQNNNSNNGLDVTFRNKYGWLGSWFYDSAISLHSGYQYHSNTKPEAYKRRIVVCGNYYNYHYTFGN